MLRADKVPIHICLMDMLLSLPCKEEYMPCASHLQYHISSMNKLHKSSYFKDEVDKNKHTPP